MRRLLRSTRGRFVTCVAASNLLSGLFTGFFWVPLTMRYLPPEHFLARWGPMLLSILLALPISYWISRLSARPIQEMLEATQAISRGDYAVRVSEEGSGDLAELLHSFNQMTNELVSTEMMRSDFISTFSHKCKTPSPRFGALPDGCAAGT